MEQPDNQSPIQKLRQQLGQNLRHLPDYKIIDLCKDYGIEYEMVDANTLRIYMLLAAAEQHILENESTRFTHDPTDLSSDPLLLSTDH